MSEWGIAMYRDDGTQIDWSNEHATEIIDTFTLSPNTGTFSINKTYAIDAGAIIGIAPDNWGALWGPTGDDDSGIGVQIQYSINGNSISITFDTNQPDDDHALEVVFPTHINVYAQYTETNYDGWGIEIPGCCFPSVNVGANNYFLRIKDTFTATTNIIGSGEDDIAICSFTTINDKYNIQPTDIVFFRPHDEQYSIAYDQQTGEVKLNWNDPDGEGGWYVYPYYDYDDPVSEDIDILIFSSSIAPIANQWGFIVYAKDGNPAFTASTSQTMPTGQFITTASAHDNDGGGDDTWMKWTMDKPYGNSTFHRGDMMCYSTTFYRGLTTYQGIYRLAACSNPVAEGGDRDFQGFDGTQDLGCGRPLWFIDGSKYGF